MIKNKNILIAIASFVIGVLIASSCERDVVKVKEKVIVKNVKVTDTVRIKDTIVNPKKIYINKWKYVEKPKDSVSKDTIKMIEANEYNQELVGKNGNAKIKLITTGELLDLSGVIECNEKTIEKTITKYTAKNKVFFTGGLGMGLNGGFRDIKIGIDYNIKNKVLLKYNVGYDLSTNQPFTGVGIGFGL